MDEEYHSSGSSDHFLYNLTASGNSSECHDAGRKRCSTFGNQCGKIKKTDHSDYGVNDWNLCGIFRNDRVCGIDRALYFKIAIQIQLFFHSASLCGLWKYSSPRGGYIQQKYCRTFGTSDRNSYRINGCTDFHRYFA